VIQIRLCNLYDLQFNNDYDSYLFFHSRKYAEHCTLIASLQCPHGLLNRHYEKLIQCDPRLNLLSKKGFLSDAFPLFDSKSTVFQDQDEQSSYAKAQENGSHVFTQFNQLKEEYLAPF